MASVYLLAGAGRDEVRITRRGQPRLTELARIESDIPARCETHLRSLLEPWRIPGRREWFALSSEQVDAAVEATRAWVRDDLPKELDVAELAKEPSDGRLLEPDPTARRLYEELRRLKAEEYSARLRRLRAENDLRLLLGTAEEIRGLARWKSQTQHRFQQARFKASYGELFQQFVAPVTYRLFRLL